MEVNFKYGKNNMILEAKIEDKMNILIGKYANKNNIKDLTKVNFIYSGKIINKNQSIKDIIEIKDHQKINRIDILVEDIKESAFKKLPNFICPDCGEISLININDYKLKIFGCKNGHINNDILFEEFEKKQKIDVSKILCDECKKNNISEQ